MDSCRVLEQIREDLAFISTNLNEGLEKTYELGQNAELQMKISPNTQGKHLCNVRGSGGEWKQEVEASAEPAGLLVGAVWRYIGPFLMKDGLTFCDPVNHGADELLLLYSSLREFTKRPDLPFSKTANYNEGEQELFSMTEENSSWCIKFRTKFMYSGPNSYQTNFAYHNQALEQAHQLAANELWTWLKPKDVTRARTPKFQNSPA